MDQKDNIHIVLIGAGKLAFNLGQALIKAGHIVDQVFSRTEESAKGLAELLHAKWTVKAEEVHTQADFYIFSVKDDVLEALIQKIVPGRKGVFLHTAGSMPMEVFKPYTGTYGVAYPMQTFTKGVIVDFKEIPCFVEASDYRSLLALIGLIGTVSEKIFRMDSAQRKVLHLAAVFACNFTNHCYALAEQLLKEQHLPFNLLFPLIRETERKAELLSPSKAQTGPAIRYDQNVLEKQRELLKEHPLLLKDYDTLSESIHILSQSSEKTHD